MSLKLLSLLDEFKKFEKIIKYNNLSIKENLRDYTIDYFVPTNFLPLLNYIESNKINSFFNNYGAGFPLSDYDSSLLFYKKFKNNGLKESEISDEFGKVLNHEYGWTNTLMFLISEMLNNIFDHSNFKNAYILAQDYTTLNTIDISIMDDGISIPGNFEKSSFEFENDCDAIFQAINGKSSDILKNGMRGTGLNSSINLVTNGNKGSFLVASREGLVFISGKNTIFKEVEKGFLNGTLISFRLNKEKTDIYPYMEPINIESDNYG